MAFNPIHEDPSRRNILPAKNKQIAAAGQRNQYRKTRDFHHQAYNTYLGNTDARKHGLLHRTLPEAPAVPTACLRLAGRFLCWPLQQQLFVCTHVSKHQARLT